MGRASPHDTRSMQQQPPTLEDVERGQDAQEILQASIELRAALFDERQRRVPLQGIESSGELVRPQYEPFAGPPALQTIGLARRVAPHSQKLIHAGRMQDDVDVR